MHTIKLLKLEFIIDYSKNYYNNIIYLKKIKF